MSLGSASRHILATEDDPAGRALLTHGREA